MLLDFELFAVSVRLLFSRIRQTCVSIAFAPKLISPRVFRDRLLFFNVGDADGILHSLFCHLSSFLRPPWTEAPPESKELLAFCLKKIKGEYSFFGLLLGLKQVKLIDAEFVWTEPHSKRIKVNLTVQKEAFGVILQQSFIVCFIVEAKTCEDCIMESIEHSCKAVVQLRQKVAFHSFSQFQVEHKRTFYFLEQQIIKANMHRKAVNIESQPDGLDFFFPERSDARGFMQWLKGCVPIKYSFILPFIPSIGIARQLLSQDFSSNIAKFKYCYVVDILPICKDDLVIFPKKICSITVNSLMFSY